MRRCRIICLSRRVALLGQHLRQHLRGDLRSEMLGRLQRGVGRGCKYLQRIIIAEGAFQKLHRWAMFDLRALQLGFEPLQLGNGINRRRLGLPFGLLVAHADLRSFWCSAPTDAVTLASIRRLRLWKVLRS